MPRQERTLAAEVALRGTGLFTNRDVSVRLCPAGPGTGVVFRRADLFGSPAVPATLDFAVERERHTVVADGPAEVHLTEHLLAALYALRVDNCRVELDGPEVPGMDGSAAPFVAAIESVGTVAQDRLRRVLDLAHSVTATDGDAGVVAVPAPAPDPFRGDPFRGDPARADAGLRVRYSLDYGTGSPVPRGTAEYEITPDTFRRRIAPARTFVLQSEITALRAAGYGLRVTEADVCVFGPSGIVGDTLRFRDEPARHKLLDVVGDLALLGVDVNADVISVRGGHALNRRLARQMRAAAVRQPRFARAA